MTGPGADDGFPLGAQAALGVRLRAAADQELGDSEREALETHLARSLEDRSRIQFERELRDAVGRAMGGVRAPESLRARVQEIMDAAREDAMQAAAAPGMSIVQEAPNEPEPQSAADSAPERLAPITRERSFWSRRQIMSGLAAAAVLVVASVFVWSMSGISVVPLSSDQEAYRAQLVRHVASEHERMEDPQAARRKLVMHEPLEVESFFLEVIGAPSADVRKLIEDTANCVFSGAGNCHVPGADGAAAHITFDVLVGDRRAPVSVFVSRDPGRLPIETGVTYAIDAKACGAPGERVLAWTDGRLLYVMVSKEADDACTSMLSRLGRPAPSKRL